MLVYVVGEGEYSDFHIIGVFSNLPEKYKEQKEFTIEEFELDKELFPNWKYFPYVVSTNINTGSFITQSRSMAYLDSTQEIKDKNFVSRHKPKYYNKKDLSTISDWLLVTVDAKNEKHAIKVATDLFAQYLVENKSLGN